MCQSLAVIKMWLNYLTQASCVLAQCTVLLNDQLKDKNWLHKHRSANMLFVVSLEQGNSDWQDKPQIEVHKNDVL